MPITTDIYVLGQSTPQTIVANGEEIRMDLSLVENPPLTGGTITGTIVNEASAPVSGAVIKIMDNTYTPLAHTVTNADGQYTFAPVTAGTNLRLFASAPGYTLGSLAPVTLADYQVLVEDFTLVADPTLTKSLIAGDVFNESDAPIEGVVAQLYSVGALGVETLVSTLFTNQYGQYVFRDLDIGTYRIQLSLIGYLPLSIDENILADNTIINVVSTLAVDPNAAKGTVSGIITDDLDAPIVGADVILYQVEVDNSLTPVAMTKTIANGVYLFVNTTQGKYVVKSSKSTIIV